MSAVNLHVYLSQQDEIQYNEQYNLQNNTIKI